jgi:hypothetical protein
MKSFMEVRMPIVENNVNKSVPVNPYEKFTTEVWKRSALKGAPYNPRKIDPKSMKALKENIKKVGYLSGITANRVTGNIVAGHQRVEAMDALMLSENKGKTLDYSLTVAVVELDEITEKSQNVFMNNPDVQGNFDITSLMKMFEETPGLNVDDMGFFSAESVNMLTCGQYKELFDGRMNGPVDEEDFAGIKKDAKQYTQEQIDEFKAVRKNYRFSPDQVDDGGFMLHTIFHTKTEKQEFLKAHSLDPYEDFISKEAFMALIKTIARAKVREFFKLKGLEHLQDEFETLLNKD